MKGVTKIILGVTLLLLTGSPVLAATDGTIGATSTGVSTVSLTIPEYVVVSGMANFAFGSWNGTSALDMNDNIIISGNDDQGSPTYKVNIVGDGGTGDEFYIHRTVLAPATEIPYTVSFNDQTGTGGASAVTKAVDITGQSGINTALDSVTENANLRVQISLAALKAAPRGSYTGTLTIVVTPE